MENENNIINGWEYVTEIKPQNSIVEQKIQNSYLMHYNLAYHKFIKSLCIDKETLDSIVQKQNNVIDNKNNLPNTKYRLIIDTNEENDILNNEDEYPIKFTKSKFIIYKIRKLKTDLISYYKPLGFFIKGPFEIVINKKINKYFIELCWNNNNNNNNNNNGNENN
jgi:hypothetical protein